MLFSASASKLQVATYLLGVCPSSIAFLVFLNSSVSFVVSDLIGLKEGHGDAVGTLGFADELLALAACPAWGILSDKIGVRWVCTIGYLIIGLSLFLFVQATNVYPQLLLGRLFFSLGGSAVSTMVTAVLPSIAGKPEESRGAAGGSAPNPQHRVVSIASSHTTTPSVSSELTITPARFRSLSPQQEEIIRDKVEPSSSRMAGFVGMFAGCGALLALMLFLPLPARFERSGYSAQAALKDSYYIVGSVAFAVSIFCVIGFRSLKGEEHKGWEGLIDLLRSPHTLRSSSTRHRWQRRAKNHLKSYWDLLYEAVLLGFRQPDIGLGYVGGFVARASSVGISLFIPLLVNSYFISSGQCSNEDTVDPTENLGDIKRNCPKAYILASILTGVSQLVALVCAPLFGYLSSRRHRFNYPLVIAAVSGIIGYILLAALPTPEISGPNGTATVFLAVSLMGISQIGAIVCSLGTLSDGVLRKVTKEEEPVAPGGAPAGQLNGSETQALSAPDGEEDHDSDADGDESASLLRVSKSRRRTRDFEADVRPTPTDSAHLKGSIAGIYSLHGGAGILILTKLGGSLFDSLSRGAPFYIMAIFNAILLVFTVGSGVWKGVSRS